MLNKILLQKTFLFRLGGVHPHGPYCDWTSPFSNVSFSIEVALRAFKPFGLIGHSSSLCFDLLQ
jgi:hypothetical protein